MPFTIQHADYLLYSFLRYFVVMSTRILTLFGEEIIPEEINAIGKSRAVPKEPKETKEKTQRKKAVKKEQEDLKETEIPSPEEQKQEEEAVVIPTEPVDINTNITPEEETIQQEPAAEVQVEPKAEILGDWKGEKQYYSIGEVAALFKVKTSNIRFWTNEFGLKVRTTRKGDRLYNPAQIAELKTIYSLVKESGYTIAGAKAKLKANKKAAVQNVDVKKSLLQLRNKLIQLRNQIT